MTFSLRNRFKFFVKDSEFSAPLAVIRSAISAKIIAPPYRPYDDEQEVIFIHIPKVAGTSIRRALSASKSYHIPLARYLAYDEAKFARYFKFCFVRNPWDRMYSGFHYLHARRSKEPIYLDGQWASHYLSGIKNFSEFVERLDRDAKYRSAVLKYKHFRPQIDWISLPNSDGLAHMDFIGRYENLSDDYAYLRDRLKLSLDLPAKRVRRDTAGYRRSYSSAMVDTVGSIYQQDVDTFGYAF